MSRELRLPPVYPIVDVVSDEPAEIERATRLACEVAGAGIVQLRAKGLDAATLTTLAKNWTRTLGELGCRLVVNDRVDVALVAGAAAAHIGDRDLPPDAARRVAAERIAIGLSTHSVAEAAAADPSEVDYIGFGPVFASPTKAGVREARGVDLLADACGAARVPVVAIGGITLASAPECWLAGATSVAVISELAGADDAGRMVAEYGRTHASLER